jgi:hypothetical protein
MGTDIRGWVEFRDAGLDAGAGEVIWYPVIDAGALLDRGYSAFGSLFGVRNYSNFTPIAAGRGLPDDVSEAVRKDAAWEGNHDPTWITWREIQQIDWDESVVDAFVREYKRSPETGEWVLVGGFRPSTPLDRQEGDTWGKGDQQFRIERVTRRTALGDAGFDLVFEMMEALAKRYGDQYVRLVVWFDD